MLSIPGAYSTHTWSILYHGNGLVEKQLHEIEFLKMSFTHENTEKPIFTKDIQSHDIISAIITTTTILFTSLRIFSKQIRFHIYLIN